MNDVHEVKEFLCWSSKVLMRCTDLKPIGTNIKRPTQTINQIYYKSLFLNCLMHVIVRDGI